MGKRYPDPHFLMTLRNKGLPAADVISELFDNMHDAGATECMFEFARNKVVATDNGNGISDLDLMFGLGWSQSKSKRDAIGEFGIGSKDAQLHFGTHCRVQSVHLGRYYEDAVDWAEIEATHDWGDTFSGKSAPASSAPEAIQGGGTIITISNLTPRPRVNMDLLIKRLSHRYRPGLLAGDNIRIIDSRKAPRLEWKLTPSLAKLGLHSGTKVSGEVAGRAFTVMYSMLKEYDQVMSGVHFGFGHRFITQTSNLGERAVPPLLYAEIMLSSDWKGCFSPNKTKIVKHYAELQIAVFDIMRDWIKKLSHHSEHLKIEHVNLQLQADFANVIVLNPKKPGPHVAGVDVDVSEGGRTKTSVKPNPHVKKQEAVSGERGQDAERKKRRPGGLSFERAELGAHVISAHKFENNHLTVFLNGDVAIIKLAYEPPYKPMALWPVIAREFANFCRNRVTNIDIVLPGFLDALNAQGYQVSAEEPDALADKVFAYIMKQVPLSLKERAKLNSIQMATTSEEETA